MNQLLPEVITRWNAAWATMSTWESPGQPWGGMGGPWEGPGGPWGGTREGPVDLEDTVFKIV